jgi:hypothetical protein
LLPDNAVAWRGFLGVGDPVLEQLPRASLARLDEMFAETPAQITPEVRRDFGRWINGSIRPRNVAGLGDPKYRNLYPVDFDALVDGHGLLGMTRAELVAALPALRGSPSARLALAEDPGKVASLALKGGTAHTHPIAGDS